MTKMTVSGGCLCGAVRYEIAGDLVGFYHCHCSRCRKSSGTGHGTNLAVKAASIRWLGGEARLGYYKVPEAERYARQFCTVCGSPVPRLDASLGLVIIPAGSLDGEIDVTPQARIFWDSRAPWSCAGDGLPVFAEYPPRR